MADGTRIEWTDATWNPITGCSIVSPGCTNCYAMRLAGTRLSHHPSRSGLTRETKAGPVWTGEVRFNEEWLTQPISWRSPRRIFVCAHGDLFAEGVRHVWLDRVFAVMAASPRHTFQVLTKRPERMRGYIDHLFTEAGSDELAACIDDIGGDTGFNPPLENVWLGVSVEDQARADERIPHLIATPAAMRFVSCEPLLGQVDLRPWTTFVDDLAGYCDAVPAPSNVTESLPPKLDWVIVGGESGPSARPMQISWVRSIVQQCKEASVACFVKQLGAAPVWDDGAFLNIKHHKGASQEEWPPDLRVRKFPDAR